jgi:hypothetical protein
MIKNELPKIDPASIFKRPSDVLCADNLSRAEKIDILERWAYDEREKSVAEEENMGSTTDNDVCNVFDEIQKSLIELGYDGNHAHNSPTKQRG